MLTHHSLEIDAVEHCNLRCSFCSHNAQHMTPADSQYSSEEIIRDITQLSKKFKFKVVRLVGGEPLLNKNLANIASTIKSAAITDKLILVTNGLLLDTITAELASSLDGIRVSVYPISEEKQEKINSSIQRLRAQFPNLEIISNQINFFAKGHLIERNEDPSLVAQIFAECYYREDGVNLFKGRIHRCFAARKRYKLLQLHSRPLPEHDDSISIDASAEDIDKFLKNTEPLLACQWCLGCSGKQVPHHQLQPGELDYATLADLDFAAGETYLSNLLLSWHRDRLSVVEKDAFFDPKLASKYFKQFKL